jgi:IclR family transcriptional regulator, acetate operon repressor
MKKAANNYHVPNLDRALVILDLLANHPRGLTRNEIAAASGCSTTMVYRIVMTFTNNGFLFRDEASGRYRLSSKLLDLGCAGSDEYSLALLAWPEMTALRDATDITVMLGTLYNEREGLLLETAESRSAIRFWVNKGFRTSDLHAGAGWKSILAFLPEDRLTAILKNLTYRTLTPNTITSRKVFLGELAKTRKQGYATDCAEITAGVHCVAAPVFDRVGYPVGTLSLSAPAAQLPMQDFPEKGRQVCHAAMRISEKLGWKNL